MSEKLQAFYICFALVLIDAAQRLQKPKSAIHNRLTGAVQNINRAIDMLPAMNLDDQKKAGDMFDIWEEEIRRMYEGGGSK